MALEDLRFCHHVKRVVMDDELHAGVFHSDRCSGCKPIAPELEDDLIRELEAQIQRATHLLFVIGESTRDQPMPDSGDAP